MSITTTEYTTSFLEQQELDCFEALRHNVTAFKKGNFISYHIRGSLLIRPCKSVYIFEN